jgi:hypothetical protein
MFSAISQCGGRSRTVAKHILDQEFVQYTQRRMRHLHTDIQASKKESCSLVHTVNTTTAQEHHLNPHNNTTPQEQHQQQQQQWHTSAHHSPHLVDVSFVAVVAVGAPERKFGSARPGEISGGHHIILPGPVAQFTCRVTESTSQARE